MDMNFYKNKVIMVTGGCGSVGSALVLELLKYEPKRILIFDNSEGKHILIAEKNIGEDIIIYNQLKFNELKKYHDKRS